MWGGVQWCIPNKGGSWDRGVGKSSSICHKSRVLIKNCLTRKAGQKNLEIGEFGKFTSMQKCGDFFWPNEFNLFIVLENRMLIFNFVPTKTFYSLHLCLNSIDYSFSQPGMTFVSCNSRHQQLFRIQSLRGITRELHPGVNFIKLFAV
jgi:hypothetical protein